MIVRKGLQEDLPGLQELLERVQMSSDIDPQDFLVAEEAGAIAGAVRLEWVEEEFYLRAMVVAPGWQRRGVGSKLVDELIDGLDQVKLVALGSAIPFYKKLGFRSLEWNAICEEISGECDGCPDRSACNPQPMIYERIK